MKIMDFLSEKAVKAELKSRDKKAVIEELVDVLVQTGQVQGKEEVIKVLLDREKLGSTGIGDGVAIPHAKSGAVKELIAAFGKSSHGIEFESLDGKPAHLFFLLVAPPDSAGPHLKALARLSRILKDKSFRDALIGTGTSEEIIKQIKEQDGKTFSS